MMETKNGTYHLKLNGEFITKFLREIGIDDMMKAIDIGMEDIGMTYQQAFHVCSGDLKLVGTGDMHLEKDNEFMLHGKSLYKQNFDINMVGLIPLEENPFQI